jgi:uncharacterized protein YjbI with pentapeptide repeats
MSDPAHFSILRNGVHAWNKWRQANHSVVPDLSEADLSGLDLAGIDLNHAVLGHISLDRANLTDADLSNADLREANIRGATLVGANFSGAQLDNARFHGVLARGANFERAQGYHAEFTAFLPDYDTKPDLTGAKFNYGWFLSAAFAGSILDDVEARRADFSEADFRNVHANRINLKNSVLTDINMAGADLVEANFEGAGIERGRLRMSKLAKANLTAVTGANTDFLSADLQEAVLDRADLTGADFREARLDRAQLARTQLRLASFVSATLDGANLTGSKVYGVSAWKVSLAGAAQHDLVITPDGEPVITTDDLEIAQFIYLMLDSSRIRRALDAITSKAVLILGRFTREEKAVLNAIRDHLRTLGLLSIICDFDPLANRNITETVTLLAGMARFVVADLTAYSSMPQELQSIVTNVHVPVQLIVKSGTQVYSMITDILEQDAVLPIYEYADEDSLMHALSGPLLDDIEGKRQDILRKRQSVTQYKRG